MAERDLRTNEERRQDAFLDFIKSAGSGSRARIMFAGTKITVEIAGRTDNDWEGAYPGNKIVTLKIVSRPSHSEGLAFNTAFGQDDTELLKKL